MHIAFWIFIFLSFGSLYSEPLPLSLAISDNLEAFDGKEVEVLGFLYHTENDQWVLASHPNLRSCCVKNSRHLVIVGPWKPPLTSSDRAITMKGIFRKKDDLEHPYSLEEASIIHPPRNYWWPIAVVFLIVVIAIMALRLRGGSEFPKELDLKS